MNQHGNLLGPSTLSRRGVSTRSQNNNIMNIAKNKQLPVPGTDSMMKRKADFSPSMSKTTTKRLAFGDLTNNTAGKASNNAKKLAKGKTIKSIKAKLIGDINTTKPSVKMVEMKTKPQIIVKQTRPSAIPEPVTIAPKRRSASSNIAPRITFVEFGKPATITNKPALAACKVEVPKAAIRVQVEAKRIPSPKQAVRVEIRKENVSPLVSSGSSSCSSSADNPLYVTAREVLSPADVVAIQKPAPLAPKVPANVIDFDSEHTHDQFQVSEYAMDIFSYLQERESKFVIGSYMERQFCLTTMMRSLLIDWMVEVQETFELNHETLYLAVKLVDLYLTRVTVVKETLQLVGAASIFIASKFDERIPPLIEDFLYICDGAYTHDELVRAEMNVVKVVDFDLGIPLSYRFLRRYARCAKVTMPILTLARFVLEYSLMDYTFVTYSDSKMAAACLMIALRMKKISGWTPTLEYYTSYKLEDFKSILLQLNAMLHREPKDNLSTIRNKYSHKIFFEVAKVPLMSNVRLLNPELPEKVVVF